MGYLIFDTKKAAVDAEKKVCKELGLPNEFGQCWDIPEKRSFDGELKWSIIPHEILSGKEIEEDEPKITI